uniref:Guanidino acid hydrolase, mitochondrial n=1 Tax=Sus scrofa TaxID=9823 RepID=A0A8D1F0B1_PIG
MLQLLVSGCARGLRAGVGVRGLLPLHPASPATGLGNPGLSPSRQASNTPRNQPPKADFVARSVGICSMMRLPVQASPEGLDAAFIGVPLDIGTSNRPGARCSPRKIKSERELQLPASATATATAMPDLFLIQLSNITSDLHHNQDPCRATPQPQQRGIRTRCVTYTKGGDHTITYPILQAMSEKHGPVGLVHVDAHMDTADKALGEKLYHGSPFRRCVEEGLLDCKRVVQIGIRGSSLTLDTYSYSRSQGFRVVLAEDCWLKSLVPLMGEVRQQMGGKPIYISFDIDSLDPAYAPGTGTPEIAGLTPSQALEIIRGCQGLNVVGCDLVEVSPPYDPFGNTALLAANLLFEMLCVLPKVTVV